MFSMTYRVAFALQQAHELLLAAHRRVAQQANDGGATRLAVMVREHGTESTRE
jgi:hypothetical protein